jgi:signal transduction histidine kinase
MMDSAFILTAQNRTTTMANNSRVKILLIEDNPGDARLVEILLDESDFDNYDIINKQSLNDGIEIHSQMDFAVVLLDLSLPDSRGFETLERFVQAQPMANVIVMTGLSDKALGLNAVKAGAQDFLMKGGFDPELLAKTLRYAIERKNVLNSLDESQRARKVAEESAKMKENFIASISHEMRTPMNAIYGMSNLLAQTTLNEEQRSYIDSVKQSSEILLGVINDILEVSTLQNSKMEFESKDFDLKEMMENMLKMMQYKKNEKPLDFHLNMDASVPQFIRGDKLRLNQILFNVVGNSVKFTDKGFVKVDVQCIENKGDTYKLKFIIKDSGIGIPPDKVDTIFETFTRIRTKDRIFEGTGLGLAIVKSLVTQQDGKVWATSEVGVGTTTYVELTFGQADSVEEVAAQAAIPNDFELSRERPFRLLLVEDHKMNQIVAKKTLEKQFLGINITIANHGREALDILEVNNDFDVILMDIQMPIMDGNETVAYIRQNMPQITTPILAMTAHAYISKDNIFKSYGFDNFVLKPFEPNQLFAKIHHYITVGIN